jgi:hypothetical protein
MGLRVLAEGVETAAQAAAVQRAGCTGAQGFYFGRPVPAPALAAEVPALNRLFAGVGGATGRGVLGSEDGGATWGPVGSPDMGPVAALALDSARNLLYAGASTGLWQLADPRPSTR